MTMVLIWPLIVPLASALACLAAWRHRRLQTLLGLAGAATLLAAAMLLCARVVAAGVIAIQIGGWPAPYGITLVADHFSAGMVLLTAFIGLAVACYSVADIDEERKSLGYYGYFHLMLFGVCGAFLTGDLFNFYVWFEVTLTASFVLISLGGTKAQLKGTVTYLALNLVASAFLLAAIGLLYGRAGTLNMADLAHRLGAGGAAQAVYPTAMLFFVAFGIKAALFPLFFWLPASYHTPPAAVTSLFAGLLTKLGMYGMIRIFCLFFLPENAFNQPLLLSVAGATMIAGALGALTQTDLNRLFSFSIVSQMGYILMGLGLFNRLALAGAFFFMLHESLAKTALFLTGGIFRRQQRETDIRRLGEIADHHPYLAAGFLMAGLSLAGLPPLSGFAAKYSLVRAGLDEGAFVITGIALGVAVLTLGYVMRIWRSAFWKPADKEETGLAGERPNVLLMVPAGGMALMSLLLGLFGGPVIAFCLKAGHQLGDPTSYIHTVMGKSL